MPRVGLVGAVDNVAYMLAGPLQSGLTRAHIELAHSTLYRRPVLGQECSSGFGRACGRCLHNTERGRQHVNLVPWSVRPTARKIIGAPLEMCHLVNTERGTLIRRWHLGSKRLRSETSHCAHICILHTRARRYEWKQDVRTPALPSLFYVAEKDGSSHE